VSRIFSITAFAAVLLAFALPFGAVSSCDGEEVHFTGVELATFTVPPDSSYRGDLHRRVERNAGVLALIALGAAAVGLALAVIGRTGRGVCAAVGLLNMQLLFWAVLLTSDGGDLFVGFWLVLASFAAVAALHLALGIRSRSQRGITVRAYVVRTALILAPTLTVVVLVAIGLLAGA